MSRPGKVQEIFARHCSSISTCDIHTLMYVCLENSQPLGLFPSVTVTKQRVLLRTPNTHLSQPFKCLPQPSPWGSHWIVLVPNVDGRGQWYCHPFRGFCGHVAHPLACFVGSGWMQPAGRSSRWWDGCPGECQTKQREVRWGQGGAGRLVKRVWGD